MNRGKGEGRRDIGSEDVEGERKGGKGEKAEKKRRVGLL